MGHLPNSLNQIAGYSYDPNGDQNTDIWGHTLAFDANGMLSSVAGGQETYTYDAQSDRVAVTDGSDEVGVVHGVEGDAPLQPGCLIAEPRRHPGMGALVKTKRKQQQDKLKYGNQKSAGLQNISPWPGSFRVARGNVSSYINPGPQLRVCSVP